MNSAINPDEITIEHSGVEIEYTVTLPVQYRTPSGANGGSGVKTVKVTADRSIVGQTEAIDKAIEQYRWCWNDTYGYAVKVSPNLAEIKWGK